MNAKTRYKGIQKSTNALGKDNKAVVTRTKQGFEETIGTNHIGHFYLSQLLLANLGKTSSKEVNSRVVYVGSGVHNPNEPGGDVGSKATLGESIYIDVLWDSPHPCNC
jgi:NAD(P)-dependent dehydrogenase (short-subunit alcohol dehydrogenase family)